MEGLERAVESYMRSSRPDLEASANSTFITTLAQQLLSRIDDVWRRASVTATRPAYEVMYRCPHTGVRVTIKIEPRHDL